jgi:DNA repair photolyase
VRVSFSIPTLDEQVWRSTEPATPHPRRRLEALRLLVGAGIRAGVSMAPILPGVSDRPEQLEQVVRAAREAGATSLWVSLLNLRGGTREHFLARLAEDFPDQIRLYERLYGHRAYLRKAAGAPVQAQVEALRRRYRIADRRSVRLTPAGEHEQLTLVL